MDWDAPQVDLLIDWVAAAEWPPNIRNKLSVIWFLIHYNSIGLQNWKVAKDHAWILAPWHLFTCSSCYHMATEQPTSYIFLFHLNLYSLAYIWFCVSLFWCIIQCSFCPSFPFHIVLFVLVSHTNYTLYVQKYIVYRFPAQVLNQILIIMQFKGKYSRPPWSFS